MPSPFTSPAPETEVPNPLSEVSPERIRSGTLFIAFPPLYMKALPVYEFTLGAPTTTSPNPSLSISPADETVAPNDDPVS